MSRFLVKWGVPVVVFAVAAAACSKSSTPPVASSSSAAKASAPRLPRAKTVSQPVIYGYYDGHVDAMLSTDVSSKAQAAAQHINFSAALANRPANTFPFLYMVSGHAAPNQPVVFGSEPGESDYSPVWDEVTVKWKPGVTPVLLVKDDQIKALAAQGKLTFTPTQVVLDCPIVKTG